MTVTVFLEASDSPVVAGRVDFPCPATVSVAGGALRIDLGTGRDPLTGEAQRVLLDLPPPRITRATLQLVPDPGEHAAGVVEWSTLTLNLDAKGPQGAAVPASLTFSGRARWIGAAAQLLTGLGVPLEKAG